MTDDPVIRSYRCSKCCSTIHNQTRSYLIHHLTRWHQLPLDEAQRALRPNERVKLKQAQRNFQASGGTSGKKMRRKALERKLKKAQRMLTEAHQRIQRMRVNKKHGKPVDFSPPRQPHPFYDSREWRQLRYRALALYGHRCMACRKANGQMHVDHIKPRSKHPHLEMEISNLQILCADCNLGKGAWDETDWRPNAAHLSPLGSPHLDASHEPSDAPALQSTRQVVSGDPPGGGMAAPCHKADPT